MVVGLTYGLHCRGLQSTVFAPLGRRVGTGPELLNGAEVRLFTTGLAAGLWTGYCPKIQYALDEVIQFHDIVHIHELWHYPHYAAYRTAWASGKPYVITVHGAMNPWSLRQKWLKKSLYMMLVQRRILERAAAIHVFSEGEAQHVRAQGIGTPIEVIPNGISPADFKNSLSQKVARKRFPALDGTRVILFLGRIHRHKGLDILAQAFIRLALQQEDVHLVIAGPDEGDRSRIESLLAAGGVLNRTLFTGLIKGEDKAAAYAAADVFVLPSHGEGMSISVLEALGAGLPIIITKQCQFPDVVDAGAGLVIDPEPGQLYDALKKMLDHPRERQAMGARGQEMVNKKYTWDKISDSMYELYSTVLRHGSSA